MSAWQALKRDPVLAEDLQPITIAIIDDGIDTTDQLLHNRVVDGNHFCTDDESPSFFVSAGGHGTTMARIVTRVFPAANIVSLKLDEHAQADGSTQFSVQSATAAVEYAAKMVEPSAVDIISMSWSIEPTERADGTSIEYLNRVVSLAVAKQIQVFCSANDQGESIDNSYPGKCHARSALFKIGAATATGTEYPYVAQGLGNNDFLLPGRIVETEKDEEASEAVTRGRTAAAATKPLDRSKEGSSIATAFAAGLAGLILHVIQLTALYYREDTSDNVLVTMEKYEAIKKDPTKMKKIFKNIGVNNRNFVEVWKCFDGADQLLKTGGRAIDAKFKYLLNICTRLIAGIPF